MTGRGRHVDGRRRRAGPGWLATLAGAGLLVLLGFGVGLVAGVAWEEPSLVMDHLAGRSTEVPLEAPLQAAAPAPAPTQEPPRPLGSRLPEARDPAPRAPLPEVAAAPPAAPRTGGFSIQVGAFGEKAPAAGLAALIRDLGLPAGVVEEGSGPAPFKVRVGPFPSRPEAERLAAKLKREQRLPTWILSQDPR